MVEGQELTPSGATVAPAARPEEPAAPGDLAELIRLLAETFPPRPQPEHPNDAYQPALAAEVVMRVAGGETLKTVMTGLGLHPQTFRGWVARFPEVKGAWEGARKAKASALFDEALDLARDLSAGKGLSSEKINALRVAIETFKWAASKLSPQEYGDKQVTTPPIAIQIVTPLDLGRQDGTKASGMFNYSISARPMVLDGNGNEVNGDETPRVKARKDKKK